MVIVASKTAKAQPGRRACRLSTLLRAIFRRFGDNNSTMKISIAHFFCMSSFDCRRRY
jgi:hypothetical protein